jgi:hypothetical protein
VRLALVVAIACACGGEPPALSRPARPPPPRYDPREMAELADGMFDVLDTMAAVVDAHRGDCPGMGRELSQLFDKAAPITARIHAVAADKDGAAALAAQVHRHDADASSLDERISEGLRPCANDADVRAAIEKMPVF